MASVVQEYTGAPSTIVVQAPQLARSQTRLGPVTSSRWRRVSSRVVRGSTVVLCSWPLTLSVISTAPETTFGPASCTASAAARPGPRRKSRRLWPGAPPLLLLGSCFRIARLSLQFHSVGEDV